MKRFSWTYFWLGCALVSCETKPREGAQVWRPPVQSYPETAYQRSIHFYDWKVDPDITNGECYEEFRFDLPDGVERVSLPAEAVVYRVPGREVRGQVKKILSSAGHTDRPFSIVDYRPKMGVVAKVSRKTLHLCAFGAQGSFEGGVYVKLRIGVPEGVKIQLAKERTDEERLKTLLEEGWWPVSTSPGLKSEWPLP